MHSLRPALIGVLLVGIAAIYVGFAIADGRRALLLVEALTALVFLGIALARLWLSPLILAAGYSAHSVWDVVHRPHGVATTVRAWYPPFCAVYDGMVGVYIAVGYLLFSS